MVENKREFYHSKGKLFIGIVFQLLFIALGVLLVNVAYIDESVFFILLALFLIILFSFFAGANTLKIIRRYPYITITDEYIQLDSFTKSEATIYFTDIKYLKVTEMSFQSNIEIVLYDEDTYFSHMSFHNKVRLCMNRVFGFSLFTIGAKAVRKQERPALLKTLDGIIQQKINNEVPINESALTKNIETDFMKKYDPTPPVDRSINRSYFLKSYGYGSFIFALSFILFYFLISKDNNLFVLYYY